MYYYQLLYITQTRFHGYFKTIVCCTGYVLYYTLLHVQCIYVYRGDPHVLLYKHNVDEFSLVFIAISKPKRAAQNVQLKSA